MAEFDQLVASSVGKAPKPDYDVLFHKTRASERHAAMWKGIAAAAVVISLVLLGILAIGSTAYQQLVERSQQRADVRDCKDTVFALTADKAFTTGEYPARYIIEEYEACDQNPHHKIPLP